MRWAKARERTNNKNIVCHFSVEFLSLVTLHFARVMATDCRLWEVFEREHEIRDYFPSSLLIHIHLRIWFHAYRVSRWRIQSFRWRMTNYFLDAACSIRFRVFLFSSRCASKQRKIRFKSNEQSKSNENLRRIEVLHVRLSAFSVLGCATLSFTNILLWPCMCQQKCCCVACANRLQCVVLVGEHGLALQSCALNYPASYSLIQNLVFASISPLFRSRSAPSQFLSLASHTTEIEKHILRFSYSFSMSTRLKKGQCMTRIPFVHFQTAQIGSRNETEIVGMKTMDSNVGSDYGNNGDDVDECFVVGPRKRQRWQRKHFWPEDLFRALATKSQIAKSTRHKNVCAPRTCVCEFGESRLRLQWRRPRQPGRRWQCQNVY